ncbi:beta-ketoacyl synthase N-terminal-like domain-containing protein [Streptomyces sp. JJ36]|uniref:beta-ketoacyl synthase N-terminal-like domain-containing protein n=1 Tax=Streptomyces sp. JJ36 TaxID=2736645 RepID=UPI001F416D1C|nr:beta-ketoacyl synthase N-terminal-like domain-containing protein [Streptomyces sp. JJ36]MCF6524486.1 hypothetical protein [Streptomyces sp. JJ36]
MRRVVITGIGALTAAGSGHRALWDRATATDPPPAVPAEPLPAPPGLPGTGPARVARLGPTEAEEHLGRRGLRTLSTESKAFAVAAVTAARHAGLAGRWDTDPSVGVAAGTTSGGLDDYAELFAARLEGGVRKVNPAQGPQTGLNAPAAAASILLGAAGPHLTLSSGRAAALDALAESVRAVRLGRAELMLAGGVQTLGYAELRARRTADPSYGTTEAGRPFDRDRSGAVPGEAAAALAVEDAGAAARRGTVALAEVLGTGAAFGGESPARRAAEAALAEAGREPGELDAVLVSACGDGPLDAAEAEAVAALRPDGVPVCAVLGGLGDSAGAAGAVQAAVAVRALGAGLLPGTSGFRTPDPALPALDVRPTAVRRTLRRLLVLSTDPHGCATALLLGAPGGHP